MTQTNNGALAKKLAAVMGVANRIPKRGRNDFHKYDYATEADIAEAIRNELAQRNVILLPEITAIDRVPVGEKGSVLTTITMNFTFIDGDSGESVTRLWAGAGTDKEDKGLYKAMTGGEKYFLLKTFLMPTGDDPEQDDKKNGHAATVADAKAVTPVGYDEWKKSLDASANNGPDAVTELWSKSSVEHRNHLLKVEPTLITSIRDKARKAHRELVGSK